VQAGKLSHIDFGLEVVDDVVTKQRPVVGHVLIVLLYQDDGSDLDQTHLDTIINDRPAAADLPIERPTRFKLIANLKTASALRVTLPTSILLSADEAIE
jgi:hypothetical protein